MGELKKAVGLRMLTKGVVVKESDLKALALFACEHERAGGPHCDEADLERGACCNACWAARWAKRVLENNLRVRLLEPHVLRRVRRRGAKTTPVEGPSSAPTEPVSEEPDQHEAGDETVRHDIPGITPARR